MPRILAVSTLFLAALSPTAVAQPRIDRILTPSLVTDSLVAPGGLLIIKGSGFASETMSALAPPLPAKLAGAQVSIDGFKCPLMLVSPDTIHAQVPFGLTTTHSTKSVFLTVTAGEAESNPLELKLQSTHPFLVTATRDAKGPVVQLDENLRPMNGAREGDIVVLYATGLGNTSPEPAPGLAGSAVEPFETVVAPTAVFIGEAKAELLSATLAPGLPALYRLTIKTPPGGGQIIRLITEGAYDHAAEWPLPAPAGPKVTSVIGRIEPLPASLSRPRDWSPILVGAKLYLSMTVARQPEPFKISLTGDTAAVEITVKPAEGIFEGTAVVPAVPTRFGDFSQTDLRATDLLSGMPMPMSIVPASRIPPEYPQAFQILPLPNSLSPGGATGLLYFRGAIPEDGRLVFCLTGSSEDTCAGETPTASTPAATAGWKSVGATTKSYTATFRLLVDGQEVATKEVTIPIAGN